MTPARRDLAVIDAAAVSYNEKKAIHATVIGILSSNVSRKLASPTLHTSQEHSQMWV